MLSFFFCIRTLIGLEMLMFWSLSIDSLKASFHSRNSCVFCEEISRFPPGILRLCLSLPYFLQHKNNQTSFTSPVLMICKTFLFPSFFQDFESFNSDIATVNIYEYIYIYYIHRNVIVVWVCPTVQALGRAPGTISSLPKASCAS